jgi:hypothetical protein
MDQAEPASESAQGQEPTGADQEGDGAVGDKKAVA